MRKGRKFVVAMAAALFVSAVPTATFAEVIYYTPNAAAVTGTNKTGTVQKETVEIVKGLLSSGKMTLEEIQELGPGYKEALQQAAKEMSSELGVNVLEDLEEEKDPGFHGPIVTEVTLGEIYHAEYKTYELSMGNQFFLYSNIGNGGLTHEPVMIDIPANVAYTVEKDGLPYEYVSRQYISAKGTYVMKLMGIENKNVPLSEQREYQAVFRFRIQDPPPVEETEAETEKVSGTVNPSIFENTDIPVIGIPETQPAVKEETESIPAVETTVPETEPESAPADVLEDAVHKKRQQKFELATGNYLVTMENGKELTANVPEGYIGSGTVQLFVAEGDVIATTLYRNDEPVEFVNGGSVTEYGRYRVDMDGCSYFFTLAYDVGQMEYYPAPTGMKFSEVKFNGEAAALVSDQYVEMAEDGTYAIAMKGEQGERFEVTLVKDTEAPEMRVTTSKNSAEIQYLSDDISGIVLVKDGEPVSGFNDTFISEPGEYTLTIFDNAGNSSSADFTLKYQVNTYGILAVVLVILAIGGIGAFIVYTKKHTKVR